MTKVKPVLENLHTQYHVNVMTKVKPVLEIKFTLQRTLDVVDQVFIVDRVQIFLSLHLVNLKEDSFLSLHL